MTDTVAKPADSSLKTRLKSALIFAPAVLVILWMGGNGFIMMMAAAGAIGVYEWVRMLQTQVQYPKGMPYLAAGVTALALLVGGMIGGLVPGIVFLLALGFLVFAYNYSQEGPSLRLLLAGMIYIGAAVMAMIWVRTSLDNGLFHMMTLLFIVWASDSFAYFSGRAIGGPKLAPAISPKKTWAGFAGSSIGAGLVAATMACPWLMFADQSRTLGELGGWGYFILGFVLAMFGQVGDLLISFYKRRFGVKDTGTLIPGHGGILDRIDALLLVALIFAGVAVVLGA